MAKTRRTKRNGKAPIKSRNIKLVVVATGEVKKANRDAIPSHVGLVLTGVNRGKVYPYRSTSRGGTPPAKPLNRTVVGRTITGAKALADRVLGP